MHSLFLRIINEDISLVVICKICLALFSRTFILLEILIFTISCSVCCFLFCYTLPHKRGGIYSLSLPTIIFVCSNKYCKSSNMRPGVRLVPSY